MATEKTATKTKTKNDRIYVRLNSELKREFEAIAVFRGLNPSAMLHSYVVQTIHKVKGENPEIFLNLPEEDPSEQVQGESLSSKLVAKTKKGKKKETTFTTGDGKTIPLVEEGSDEK